MVYSVKTHFHTLLVNGRMALPMKVFMSTYFRAPSPFERRCNRLLYRHRVVTNNAPKSALRPRLTSLSMKHNRNVILLVMLHCNKNWFLNVESETRSVRSHSAVIINCRYLSLLLKPSAIECLYGTDGFTVCDSVYTVRQTVLRRNSSVYQTTVLVYEMGYTLCTIWWGWPYGIASESFHVYFRAPSTFEWRCNTLFHRHCGCYQQPSEIRITATPYFNL